MKFKHLKFLTILIFLFLNKINYSQTISSIRTDTISEKYSHFKYNYEDYNEHIKNKPEYKTSPPILYSYNKNLITTFKILGIVLIIAILGIILYFFNTNKGLLFNKKSHKVLSEEYINENILEIDLKQLLNQAIKDQNKELVIRYQFLTFLKNLSSKNYIDWNPEKTNTDYFYEIKNKNLKTDFEYASYLYTYIWYGKYEVTDEIYKKATHHFNTIINKY